MSWRSCDSLHVVLDVELDEPWRFCEGPAGFFLLRSDRTTIYRPFADPPTVVDGVLRFDGSELLGDVGEVILAKVIGSASSSCDTMTVVSVMVEEACE